jgi:hypothetical protein
LGFGPASGASFRADGLAPTIVALGFLSLRRLSVPAKNGFSLGLDLALGLFRAFAVPLDGLQ